jgi:hypothetical protein
MDRDSCACTPKCYGTQVWLLNAFAHVLVYGYGREKLVFMIAPFAASFSSGKTNGVVTAN